MAKSERVVVCADCMRELRTEYDRMYHCCPQKVRANRRAQRRQRQDVLDPVADELARSPWPPR